MNVTLPPETPVDLGVPFAELAWTERLRLAELDGLGGVAGGDQRHGPPRARAASRFPGNAVR